VTAKENTALNVLAGEMHEMHEEFGDRITRIEIAICGDGTKGLAERVNDLELRAKPIDRATILKTRAAEMGIGAAVIALILKMPDIIAWIRGLIQ